MTARDSKGRFARKGRKVKSRRAKSRKGSKSSVTSKAVSLARKLLATVGKRPSRTRRSKSRNRR